MANKLPDKGAVAGNVFPATAPLSSSRESGQNGRQEVDLFVLLPVLGGQDTSLALADEGDELGAGLSRLLGLVNLSNT